VELMIPVLLLKASTAVLPSMISSDPESRARSPVLRNVFPIMRSPASRLTPPLMVRLLKTSAPELVCIKTPPPPVMTIVDVFAVNTASAS